MNIALFGGTFDPVHLGHLAVAEAAQAAFHLDQILFVPAGMPPHKRRRHITPFAHRYAMVALACAGHPAFLPSLLEWDESGAAEPNYSILTIRKMAAGLAPDDRLFFMVGVDSFLDIATWREPVALLDACDFIIVSRPGFAIEKIAGAIPEELRPAEVSAAGLVPGGPVPERIPLRRSCLHLLTSVHSDVSASEIRRRAARQEPLCGLVPDAVGDYIQRTRLYVNSEQTAAKQHDAKQTE